MNKKSAVLTLSLGIVCALFAAAFAFNLGNVSTLLPAVDKAVWGMGGCAAALIICGLFALAHKPTRQEIIEQNDERNATINGKAALRSFEVFGVLVPLVSLTLYIVGQISAVGMLALIAAEIVASIVYFALISHLQKTI